MLPGKPRWKLGMEHAGSTRLTCKTETELLWREEVQPGGKYNPPQLVLCFQIKEEELGPLETNQISLASRLRVITAKLSLSAAGTVC